MGLKILLEGVHCGSVLAFCGIDYPEFIQVNKDTYIIVASSAGGFINTNIDDITEIFLLSSLFYVVLDNPPYPCIMFSYQIGKGIDRHGFGKFNDQRLKQHGKSRTRPGPRHYHLFYPMSLAIDPGNITVDVSTVLKEVQMPPGAFYSIMDTAFDPALRTGMSAASFPGYIKVQPAFVCIKLNLINPPGVLQS